MKVEDRIERAKTDQRRSRLSALLGAKPVAVEEADPALLRLRLNDQQELIGLLAQAIATAQQSLIRQQEQIMVQQGAIETLANMIGAEQADKGTGLVGFDKPKLELN